MYSSDEEGFGFGRAWTSKSSPQNNTNNIGDNVEAENFDKQQTESNQMMRMNEKGSGRDWSSHNYPSSSSRLRNRSRSPVNYSSKRECLILSYINFTIF
ncbi:MAG: hypothetical protein MHPSP_002912 [Paramarteilia canceri]